MASATSSSMWGDINAAWFKLSKQEQDVVLAYSHALDEDHVEHIMILEVSRIHELHPDFCMASIPRRFLCS